MIKQILYRLIGVFMVSLFQFSGDIKASEITAYDFSFTTLIDSKPLSLKEFEGKVILIVNTASKCGFTRQYEGLEKLYENYKDKGLVIIGVPSNDFGQQEPGSNQEIQNFCKINYGVTFPMTSKEIVSGHKAHPFYLWAKKQLGFGTAPKWNFHKYLINRKGKLIDYFNSTTSPNSETIKNSIEKELMDEPCE
jgi:glutathione peroxidase